MTNVGLILDGFEISTRLEYRVLLTYKGQVRIPFGADFLNLLFPYLGKNLGYEARGKQLNLLVLVIRVTNCKGISTGGMRSKNNYKNWPAIKL